MPRSVPAKPTPRPGKPGRPAGVRDTEPRRTIAQPEIVAFEGCAEALTAIDNDTTALREIARLATILADQACERATRLQKNVRPQVAAGCAAAGKVADLEAARRIRIARGRRIVVASIATRRAA